MVENLKLNKKSLQYLGITVLIVILVCIGLFYYLKKTELKEKQEEEPAEKTVEEILESLTAPAPEGEVEPISEDVLKSLTAPE